MSKNFFVDTFGNKWQAAVIGPTPVRIESGDYILYNEDFGFMFCTEDAFHSMYQVFVDENTEQDSLFDVDIISIQTEDSISQKNEQVL